MQLNVAGRRGRAYSDDGPGVVGEQVGDGCAESNVNVRLLNHACKKARYYSGAEGKWIASRDRVSRSSIGLAEGRNSAMLRDLLVLRLREARTASSFDVHLRVCHADGEIWADPESLTPGTQHATVDHSVGEVAPRGQSSRGLVVIVGEVGDDLPLDGTDLLPVLHGDGSRLQPEVHGLFVEELGVVVCQVAYVGLATNEVVVDPFAHLDVVGGHPHHASGVRGRTTEQVAGFQNDRPATPECNSQRSREARQACSNNDHRLWGC